jgi:THO complex subunit 2
LLDKEDTNDGTDYRFYWDDWIDNIPVCQSVEDVFALCGSFLNLSGVKIGQDPNLLAKLCRIGNESLKTDPSDSNKTRWRDLCKRLLVPALSLTKANPGVVHEVFTLLSHFPREVRYNMYAEWYFGQTSRLPDMKSAFDQARAETKDVLKRLSKTNIRPMARSLAKVAYANPGIVIHVAISQIESYENLIEVVVECARYFTDLGYDILTWLLINSLGQKGRSRVQESGLLTSKWLNALASFAGRAFKRYSSIMNPAPLLQYVAEQLRQNNSTDLIVLEQLIASMAGIVTDTSFNDAQSQAMAGGELLRSQTMLQLLDKRHESKTTSKGLMRALTESNLAGQLLIAIAQERVTCVFKETEAEAELKLLGNIFDEIHRVLTQYLDLLRANLCVEEFDSFVPEAPKLIGEFGLQPEVAFWITRPSIAQRVANADTQPQQTIPVAMEVDSTPPLKIAEDDVVMVGDSTADEAISGDAMAVDKNPEPNGLGNTEPSRLSKPSTPVEVSPWHPVLQNLMDGMKSALPPDTWEFVGLPFYVTFWQLSLYDIFVPQKSYEDESERLKKRVIAISNDRSDISMAGTQKKDREKKEVNKLHDRIVDENKRHLRDYGQTRSRLQKEKTKWFEGMRKKHDVLNIALMQNCFLPRILLSPVDALYSFKMLKFLHSSGTPNFRTLGFLDLLFRDQRLTAIIFQCTSKEADNFGRFLNEVLRDLSRWHVSKDVYEKEAFGPRRDLPGFAKALDSEGKPVNWLDYEDFRRILYKWHRLLGGALKTCLTGGEYMHIRNAISILKSIVQHFPAINWIGRDMHTCVNNLKANDPRDDVKIPAASLIGDLNRRESKWLLPQAFHVVSPATQVVQGGANPPKTEPTPADRVDAGKARTSQPQSEATKLLNATAAEFKPTPTPVK